MPRVYDDDMFPECPTYDFTCPYFKDNRCMMFKETNDLPYNECDAFWED